jgi:hypothetical protein
MIARWAVEALAHAVSLDDQKARDQLAGKLYLTEYRRVLNQESEEQITAAYRQRVWSALALLGGFNALFLALTMWALKRKDVL